MRLLRCCFGGIEGIAFSGLQDALVDLVYSFCCTDCYTARSHVI